jgi:hypothetical protein
VVVFGLTIWAALLLSSVVRFVLQEDVYPRLSLSRGAPNVVSTLVHSGFTTCPTRIAAAKTKDSTPSSALSGSATSFDDGWNDG